MELHTGHTFFPGQWVFPHALHFVPSSRYFSGRKRQFLVVRMTPLLYNGSGKGENIS
jgi:hypothetical protein